MTKYFHLGYPPDNRMPYYGLYSLYHGCFMLMYYDLAILQKIKSLWSSRTAMFIVQVSTADNYEPNLIDNDVCVNWAFSNVNDVDAMSSNNNRTYYPILADSLVYMETNEENVDQDTFLLQNILYWLTVLEFFEKDFKYQYTIIDQHINNFFETDASYKTTDSYYKTYKQILKILYLENDIEKINQNIIKIIKTNTDLYDDFTLNVDQEWIL